MTGWRFTEGQNFAAENALNGRPEMAGQPLTPAENALMDLFHGGAARSPKDLARLRSVSVRTIYLQVRGIKEKLGVRGLREAEGKIFPKEES